MLLKLGKGKFTLNECVCIPLKRFVTGRNIATYNLTVHIEVMLLSENFWRDKINHWIFLTGMENREQNTRF